MPDEAPNPRACPRCGSNQSTGGLTTSTRTCNDCGARFRPPPARWERGLVAAVFIVPSLIGLTVAVAVLVGLIAVPPVDAGLALGAGVCSAVVLAASAAGLFYGFRELGGARATRLLADPPPFRPISCVPPERARAVVRELAEDVGAAHLVAQVDWIEPARIANARTQFATDMRSDEVALVLIDSSFLRNGSSGCLLTNRSLYSSRLRTPIALEDVTTVSHRPPDPMVWVWVYALVPVVACFPPAALLYLPIIWGKNRPLHEALLVNDKVAYVGGKNLARAFWVGVFPALQAELRAASAVGRVAVLETFPQGAEGRTIANPLVHSPTWTEIEAMIRALNGADQPGVRLWAGEPGRSPGLEVIGGAGKYTLRELPDGWVYYDPAGGDEEVAVSDGEMGCRVPGYSVCTDLERVLSIARGFAETGSFE
jgi:hypothetical protein